MRKKVFFLYPYYWPLFKAGGPVQSLYNLAVKFHSNIDLYFLSLRSDIDGTIPDQPLNVNEWNKGKFGENIYCALNITPLLIYRLLKETAPNLVVINGIFHWNTSLFGLICARLQGLKIVISPRGMLQQWALNRGTIKKTAYLKLFRILIGQNVRWHATDRQEECDIRLIFGERQKAFLAANIPRNMSPFNNIAWPTSSEPIKLVFLSLINPNKNLHLVIEALNSTSSNFSLDIYGPIADEKYWTKCKNLIANNADISYMGIVPAWDVPKVLQQYHFFVLPTQGENFGHAIFDSLASSVPVIISTHTPWKQIDFYRAGFYLDTERRDSIQEILQLLTTMKEFEYQEYRKAAHEYARSYLDSKDFAQEYKFLFS